MNKIGKEQENFFSRVDYKSLSKYNFELFSSHFQHLLVYKHITLFSRVQNGCSHDFKFAETSSKFHDIL